MPLASSLSASSSRSSSNKKGRMSIPSSITSSTKVTKKKAVKRRASLRASRDPSPAPSVDRGKENSTSSPTRGPSSATLKAPASPGPTPYYVVAAERASQGKNPHSPRSTRSATKQTRPSRLPPFAHAKAAAVETTRSAGVMLSFSPPDQEANRKRDEHRIVHRYHARDGRVHNARATGQYLEFSPRSGMPRQSFDEDDDERDRRQDIFRNAKDDGVNNEALKSIQENVSKLLQAKSFDETEKGMHFATLEADNKSLVVSNEKLQETVESLEVERKELQEQMGDMKERLVVENVKLEAEVTSARREAEVNLADKLAATTKLDELREQFLIEKTRMEAEIDSLKREADIRLEGMGESHKGLKEDKLKLVARVEQLEQELYTSKDHCAELKTQQSKLGSDQQYLSDAKSRLEEQLVEMRAEKCDMEDQVQQLKETVANLEKQTDVQIGNLSKELESQIEATRQAELKLAETEQIVTNMEKELDTLEKDKEEERINFQKLNEESSKAFSKLEKDAAKKDAEMEDMSREIEAIAADLEGEQQARQNFEAMLQEKEKEESETIQKLESDLTTEQQLRQDAETKLQMAQTATGESAKELQARADSIAVDLEREQQLRQTAENQLLQTTTKMGKEVTKFKVEASDLAAALEEEQKLRAKVEKQLKQRQADLTEATEELSTQIETLEDKLALADTDRGMLQEKLDETKKAVESLSSDKSEALKHNSDTAALLKSNETAMQEMSQTMESLRQELQGKQMQLTETQLQLKMTDTERKDAVDRMKSFDFREEELLRKLRDSDRIRRDLHNKVMQLSGNIRVYVRVRPELPGEKEKEGKMLDSQEAANSRKRKMSAIEENPFSYPGILDRGDGEETGEDLCKNLMEVTEPSKDRGGLKERRKKWKFGFDNVFTPSHGQGEIWEATEPLVQSAIDGYNVCLFAYGQTGSGKTYTMLGEESNKGIITRSVAKLFDAKAEIEALSKGRTHVTIKVELLEIYNEKIRDLLSPESTANQNLKVTSNNVEGTILVTTTSSDEVMEILEIAQSRRCVKATNSNSESSRSHMVFTIHFDVTTEGGVSRKGKLHVCDLAGSERLGKSGANKSGAGSLLKETKAINSSLSVLSNVIEKLQKGNANVPFRESKLTMLLSGSLGGNSKTLAIVCCNPLASHFHESLCSLRFAEKVNKVELKASSNFSC